MVAPISPQKAQEILHLDPSKTVNEFEVIFKASGINENKRALRNARIIKVEFGAESGVSPVFDWEIKRSIAKSEKSNIPFSFGKKAAATVENNKIVSYCAEDLVNNRLITPIQQGEQITLVFYVRTNLIYELLALNNNLGSAINTNVSLYLDGWPAACSMGLTIDTRLTGNDSDGFSAMALDYGNQDFMLACSTLGVKSSTGNTPIDLRTPSMMSYEIKEPIISTSDNTDDSDGDNQQVAEIRENISSVNRKSELFNTRLMPETSRLVIHDKYDINNVIFSFGANLYKPDNRGDYESNIWQDTEFKGARIESLKPYLTSEISEASKTITIHGDTEELRLSVEVDEVERESIFKSLIYKYFNRIFDSVSWGMATKKDLSWPGKGVGRLIFTHPVGINRAFRKNIQEAMQHSNMLNAHSAEIKFMNEAMAALGSVWLDHIKHNTTSYDPEIGFRSCVRSENDLTNDGLELEDDEIHILLVDIGHGTTDISLCSASMVIEVDEFSYDRKPRDVVQLIQRFSFSKLIGGRDITKAIFKNLLIELEYLGVSLSILTNIKEKSFLFWRVLDAVEQLKKDFSATDSNGKYLFNEFNIPDDILSILKVTADSKAIDYDVDLIRTKVIERSTIEKWVQPVVDEISNMVGSIVSFFNEHRTIDFYSFVGQSMNMPFLKNSLYQSVFPNTQIYDPNKLPPAVIQIPSNDLKGIVAKGALSLLGGLYPNVQPKNYEQKKQILYAIFVGDPSNPSISAVEVVPAGTEINEEYIFEDLELKISEEFIVPATNLFAGMDVPSDLNIYVSYQDIVVGNTPLSRKLGIVRFDEYLIRMNKEQVFDLGIDIHFQLTSDEYLVVSYSSTKEKQRRVLEFMKSDAEMKESMAFYV